jgi:hypothetical protein
MGRIRTTPIRRQKIPGTDNYVVRGGVTGSKPVVVMGKKKANDIMAARRRVIEHRRDARDRARRR